MTKKTSKKFSTKSVKTENVSKAQHVSKNNKIKGHTYIKTNQIKHNDMADTVLIHIASYKDDEIVNTVKSAVIQADKPDRIYFAICLQDDDMDRLQELEKIDNCKIIHMLPEQAKGSCYARYLCQEMVENEEFVLHIDAHMRFVKHWDTETIKMWRKYEDDKAVITTYPPNYNTNALSNLQLDDPKWDKPGIGGRIRPLSFRSNSSEFMKLLGRHCGQNDEFADKKGILVAAGYLFAKSHLDKVVRFDPNMFLCGDELPMAIRMYTYGYNIYAAPLCYVYHKYYRSDRELPSTNVKEEKSNEVPRLRALIGLPVDDPIDLGEFGLGKERTVEDFEKFAGINFRTHFVSQAAVTGNYHIEADKYKPVDSEFTEQSVQYDIENSKIMIAMVCKNDLNVINRLNEYMNKADNKNRLEFFIYFRFDKLDDSIKDMIRTIQGMKNVMYQFTTNKSVCYGEMIYEMYDKIKRCPKSCEYVLNVDSDIIPMDGWDTYLVEKHKKCGDRAVLCEYVYRLPNKDSKIIPYNNNHTIVSKPNWPYVVVKIGKSIKNVYPELDLFIRDGFWFSGINYIKDVPVDRRLNFSAFMIAQSVHTFTYGYDIYYPNTCFFVRRKIAGYLDNKESLVISNNVMNILIDNISDANRFVVDSIDDYKEGTARNKKQWLIRANIDYEKNIAGEASDKNDL